MAALQPHPVCDGQSTSTSPVNGNPNALRLFSSACNRQGKLTIFPLWQHVPTEKELLASTSCMRCGSDYPSRRGSGTLGNQLAQGPDTQPPQRGEKRPASQDTAAAASMDGARPKRQAAIRAGQQRLAHSSTPPPHDGADAAAVSGSADRPPAKRSHHKAIAPSSTKPSGMYTATVTPEELGMTSAQLATLRKMGTDRFIVARSAAEPADVTVYASLAVARHELGYSGNRSAALPSIAEEFMGQPRQGKVLQYLCLQPSRRERPSLGHGAPPCEGTPPPRLVMKETEAAKALAVAAAARVRVCASCDATCSPWKKQDVTAPQSWYCIGDWMHWCSRCQCRRRYFGFCRSCHVRALFCFDNPSAQTRTLCAIRGRPCLLWFFACLAAHPDEKRVGTKGQYMPAVWVRTFA